MEMDVEMLENEAVVMDGEVVETEAVMMDSEMLEIEAVVMDDEIVETEVVTMDSEAMEPETVSVNGETLGTVKWFSRMKGWGFIEPDGGDRDVFVHYENIIGEGFRNLEKGERVTFRIEDTPRGPKAVDVVMAN